MGFNKLYISKESLMAQYSSSGIEGVKTALRGADTFICSDTLSADIVDVYDEIGTSFDIMESWSCIENILLNELPN
tara:strand:+ start:247 stop:474 length:228 start_codon:yes stop_codon:yes gene_type:complete